MFHEAKFMSEEGEVHQVSLKSSAYGNAHGLFAQFVLLLDLVCTNLLLFNPKCCFVFRTDRLSLQQDRHMSPK